MWNKLSCKSDYGEFLRKKQDKKLFNTLNKVKSVVDTSCPKSFGSNFRKPFGTDREAFRRKKQVKEENQILLRKMLKIDLQSKLDKKKELGNARSLNERSRINSQRQIKNSNKYIFGRLRSAEPVYSVEEWNEFRKFHLNIRENISRNSGRLGKKRNVEVDRKVNEADDSLDQILENKIVVHKS